MSAQWVSAIGAATAMAIMYAGAARAASKWALSARQCKAGLCIVAAGVAVSAIGGSWSSGMFGRAASTILVAALSISAITDLQYGYVFDVVTIPVLGALAICAWLNGVLMQAVSGGALCAGIIATIFLLSRGRGIGLGDLKLAGCIGLGLGVYGGVLSIGAAFVGGGLHGALLLLTRNAKRGDEMFFAPYLALGSAVSIVASGLMVQR